MEQVWEESMGTYRDIHLDDLGARLPDNDKFESANEYAEDGDVV